MVKRIGRPPVGVKYPIWARYRDVASGEEAVRATWLRMSREDGEFLRASFWELYLSDTVDVEVFVSRHIDDELD